MEKASPEGRCAVPPGHRRGYHPSADLARSAPWLPDPLLLWLGGFQGPLDREAGHAGRQSAHPFGPILGPTSGQEQAPGTTTPPDSIAGALRLQIPSNIHKLSSGRPGRVVFSSTDIETEADGTERKTFGLAVAGMAPEFRDHPWLPVAGRPKEVYQWRLSR